MKQPRIHALLAFWLGTTVATVAAPRYVNVNNATPSSPYLTWATAATNLQEAVDMADAGDEIVVTNGTYAVGGRVVDGLMTNRVAVTKPLTVRSVNGPQFTVIQGAQVPGTTNGDGAIRCVYLTNGASLSGFTLANGATRTDGQYPNDQYGGGVWCESTNAVVTNCIFSGNSAAWGGGGAYGGLLTRCTLTGNSTSGGGGAASATLNNCALVGNAAYYGGAAYSCVLNNCTVTGNSGGGVHSCTVNNCIVYYNSAPGNLNYVNYASSFPINYSCTTPPAHGLGVGNISVEPQLASASHLSAVSPCRGVGNPGYVTGTDIDGEAWANPPSMGCDEYHAGSTGGPLTVAVTVAPSTAVTGSPATFPAFFPVTLTASIEGQPASSVWDFGDGTVLGNQPYASHSWSAPGDYAVALRAYNDSNPGGVSATVTVHVVAQFVYHVAAENATPVAPFNSWSTAATNIQDAVDAAPPGSLVLVTNGVYRTGGRQVGFSSANRVMVDKALTLRSVNGPQATLIEGGFGTRCVYLANGSFLAGFTLTNGNLMFRADGNGGGVLFGDSPSDAVVSNCLITTCVGVVGGGGAPARQVSGPPGADGGTFVNCTFDRNVAAGISSGFPFPPTLGGAVTGCRLIHCTLTGNSAGGPGAAAGGGAHASILQNCILTSNSVVRGSGGGAAGSILVNCLLTRNLSDASGGAASYSSFSNCTLTANAATNEAGGALAGTLNNCIVYGNSASNAPNYSSESVLHYSCTTPLPTNGIGNFTNAPLFIDSSRGNFHLQPNSPCIDAGSDLSRVITTDLDGRPRPADGNADGLAAFDIGAYEHYTLLVRQDGTNPVPPYGTWATAATNIQDAVDAVLVGAGDQIRVTNGVYRSGSRAGTRVVVDKPVSVQSVNGPRFTIIDGGGVVRCATLTNGTLFSGFTLSNGVTSGSGGGLAFADFMSDAVASNCVIVGCSAQFGGGAASAIQVGGSFPVGGTLKNCLLSGNRATGNPALSQLPGSGGGADNCKLESCILMGNSAAGPRFGQGGGAAASRLFNCLLVSNSVPSGLGGGAAACDLTHCTLGGNMAAQAGGAYSCWLKNCIVYDNTAPFAPNYFASYSMEYCCTTPAPGMGAGHQTNAPLFLDQVSGNYRLLSNSPCINAGLNAYAPGATDLDGRPRVQSGTVDLGAYEFQPGVSGEFLGWLQHYGLPTDGSADYTDADNDSLDNWQEWIAGTAPTDTASLLRLFTPTSALSGITVSWQSVSNRTYFLERAADFGTAAPFSFVASNLLGQPGATSFTDTNATGAGPFFYRAGIQR